MRWLLLSIFWGLWFLNFSARVMPSPVLPLIENELMLSHAKAGGLFAFLNAGYAVSLLIGGSLAPRIGYKRIIIGGFICSAAALFTIQYVHSYGQLAALFLFIGLGCGVYLPSIMPMITETFPREHWGKAIGIHDTGASLSIFSIPIFVAIGLHLFHWRNLFLFLCFASMVVALLFWVVSKEPRGGKTPGRYVSIEVLKKKGLWLMIPLWSVSAACCLGVYSIIPLFLVNERAVSLSLANTIFGISRLGGVAISIVAGFLVDRFGIRSILFWTLLLTGLSTVAVATAKLFPLLVGVLFFQATVALGFFPVGLATISQLTTSSERSMAMGMVISIGVVFGVGVTPYLLGAIADRINFQTGILLVGILTTVCSFSVKYLRNGREEESVP
jgi:NNP family nitrate/nitrite transporter-like MFS transporter